MTDTATPKSKWGHARIERLLARVRGKQLETALRGRVDQSFRYAQRAMRVRQHV